ncbi:MAG TPA: DUF2752 domain-containing protein [Verrucomicrobiae bacterium]|nr:DUF2752 domain-containing protein [Verrucomicrobiae bacterium]
MNKDVQRHGVRNRWTSLRRWLADGDHAPRLWLGRHSTLMAWLGLLLALITPPNGSGFSICWWQEGTGLPCPGCGVTRSLSCGLRGRLVESVQYHPFGLPILLLFAATAVYSLIPNDGKNRVKVFLAGRAVAVNATYLCFVISFVSFGFLRSLHYWIIRCW